MRQSVIVNVPALLSCARKPLIPFSLCEEKFNLRLHVEKSAGNDPNRAIELTRNNLK